MGRQCFDLFTREKESRSTSEQRVLSVSDWASGEMSNPDHTQGSQSLTPYGPKSLHQVMWLLPWFCSLKKLLSKRVLVSSISYRDLMPSAAAGCYERQNAELWKGHCSIPGNPRVSSSEFMKSYFCLIFSLSLFFFPNWKQSCYWECLRVRMYIEQWEKLSPLVKLLCSSSGWIQDYLREE